MKFLLFTTVQFSYNIMVLEFTSKRNEFGFGSPVVQILANSVVMSHDQQA